MRNKTTAKFGYSLAVSILTAIGTIGAAQAGWTDTPGEQGIMAPGYFSNFGNTGKSPVFDKSQYNRVNLGSLSAEIYALKPGAQGPMRDENSEMIAKQWRDIEGRLGPVGGRNTP
ncbi:MAG TPA: hypothetical protein VFF82_02840 [Rhodocyclaceae bacterium]|nr:hypothetical protein [Rhodocyclaceae bacterium]